MSTPGKPNGNGNPDEIAIAQLRPVTPGCGMLHSGDLTRVLSARVKGGEGYAHGYEITWVRPRRAFRVDHFRNGEPAGTRWVPEAQVAEYVEA